MFYVKFYSSLSKIVGYAILSISGIVYVQKMIYAPTENVVTIAVTAIATIAVLSALCFSYVPFLNDEFDKDTTIYAGEKFFHSTLLIIQTLFLKFALDPIVNSGFVISIGWLERTIRILSIIILTGIGGFAVSMAALGFHFLNKIFWNHYEKRAKENLKKVKNKSKPAPK